MQTLEIESEPVGKNTRREWQCNYTHLLMVCTIVFNILAVIMFGYISWIQHAEMDSNNLVDSVATAIFNKLQNASDNGETNGICGRGASGENGLPGLKGETGMPGPHGQPGRTGDAGLQGPKGELGGKGEPGEKGVGGLSGMPGEKGEKGNIGPQGETGPTGNSGFPGYKGDQGPIGPPGPPGKPYYVSSE